MSLSADVVQYEMCVEHAPKNIIVFCPYEVHELGCLTRVLCEWGETHEEEVRGKGGGKGEMEQKEKQWSCFH